jgi:carboxymethylenebutenolidase
MAARGKVDAAVAYHGGETEKYLGEADRVLAPLLMHLGDEDEFIPAESQARIKRALSGRSNVTVHTYAGCKHAFAGARVRTTTRRQRQRRTGEPGSVLRSISADGEAMRRPSQHPPTDRTVYRSLTHA